MIGGRVLDVTAIEENIVLTVPFTALARASALIPRGHELGLDVLLGLSCTVVDALDTVRARSVGALVARGGDPCGDIAAAHVAHCPQRRGWPVLTSDPEPLLAFDSSIEIENFS